MLLVPLSAAPANAAERMSMQRASVAAGMNGGR